MRAGQRAAVSELPSWIDRGAASAATLGAFLIPGIGLWIPSGYSFGAALIFLAALLTLPYWLTRLAPLGQTGWLALAILCITWVWWMDAQPQYFGLGAYEKPLKYSAAVVSLFFLHRWAPRPQALWEGFSLGAIGGGLTGLYQVAVKGLPRASGYTNAIQYGDLCMLFGLICFVLVAFRAPWMGRRLHGQMLLGAVFGLLGALLSEARGSWLALALVMPVLALLLLRNLPRAKVMRLGASALLALTLMVTALWSEVEQRIEEVHAEVAQYEAGAPQLTSVGQRLGHWKLALQMGLDKPLLGWGRHGYIEEKSRRVADRQAHPSVLDFDHAHNELLDLFAKSGVLGLLAMLFLYAVPLWIFWPRASVIYGADGELDRVALGLRVAGLLVPLCSMGFGLTQVFTAHNSGSMNYLFLTILLYASLRAHERARAGLPSPTA